jgi:quercetin dioxygenase-like cupin family protein
MIRSKGWFRLSFLFLALLLMPVVSRAQAPAPAPAAALNASAMKFVEFPGLPTCFHGAVPMGNPQTGPSFIYARGAAGCAIPWHWHTPNEHLMIVSGALRVEMKGEKPTTLHAGAFAVMPSKHVHQARCQGACSLYIYSDAAFDIHYVNAQGNEISPAEALKNVKETAAAAPAPKK